MIPSPDWFAALEATWPPAGGTVVGPFRLRRGAGGGQRVSSAVTHGMGGAGDMAGHLELAEQRMIDWGQDPLFMVRPGDEDLDGHLQRRGYGRRDPTVIMAARLDELLALQEPSPDTIVHWPPLSICRAIWEAGGVDEARQSVIARAAPPKTAILARTGDHPSGVVFAASDGHVTMVHALHVEPAFRRNGAAAQMMARAASWAAERGDDYLAVAVVAENAPARALFGGIGLSDMAAYHYRHRAAEAGGSS